jgi:hypothetical protein
VAIVCGRGNSDILSSRPIHRFCRRASPIFQFRNTVRIKRNLVSCRTWGGGVAGVVGIEGGVVSGVINLESSGVGASDWRPCQWSLAIARNAYVPMAPACTNTSDMLKASEVVISKEVVEGTTPLLYVYAERAKGDGLRGWGGRTNLHRFGHPRTRQQPHQQLIDHGHVECIERPPASASRLHTLRSLYH